MFSSSCCSSEKSTSIRAKDPPAATVATQAARRMSKYTVVFVRHGQSVWNLENKFTGWVDVPLSEQGVSEAQEAGKMLKEHKYEFDIAYTSVLKRAIQTCNIVLEELDQLYIPVEKDYRLNERMYGALAGLNKQETVDKHGIDQVMIWRRSYDVPPPPATEDHEYYPGNFPWAKDIPKDKLPLTESLKLTLERVLPYWNETIVPMVKSGKRVLIAAHGNSIRAIIKHLDNIPEDVITKIDVPTGVPLVYEFDEDMKPIKRENAAEHLSGSYLLNPDELKKKIEAVKNQTKAK
ncbi:2,3-bisphosphoglycerate-dependent phosphoglycerate mutase [Salpingoeca rosetta]|uniref:phosphoglycerate mutase (2,3-diphosphoglycerate-dependent) n=1 Tax=Salpingoeca rosetta (strain ATCC 50818 / BSB-021) TaxID=946362 RepID=F2UIE8_SALR5|nr:2,3-bisphosphoglycerate-dependent phosphoglycerate mutase [Salpingoeca rosetta]EGD76897.1 2,3-bisphosphoglycerate-dependent phosphoglycerate mutase [Salpingoeca rosetta]|eukprot:XP_004991268.1 2,3-bisphosphoglycerate-dependent phosphoglycerate mutase [Salpingoeca rosetta]